MKKTIFYLLLFILLNPKPIKSTQKAFVCIPVADLTLNRLSDPTAQISLCSKTIKEAWKVCNRAHQLIFNEHVTIIEKKLPSVYVEIPQAYYVTAHDQTKHNRFWVPAHALAPIDSTNAHLIPPPIDFKTKELHATNPLIITLQDPFYDPITNQTFSAGTRFVKKEHSETNDSFSVWLFHCADKQFKTTKIPKKLCMSPVKKAAHESITAMVALIRKWAHQSSSSNYIPYVWGGCSFCTPHTDSSFGIESYPADDAVVLINKTMPADGFDCAKLLVRAAQACAIPLFCANTFTLAQRLDSLTPADTLKEGDLIWISGHVMLVADTTKNTLLEARGYPDGYGKLHEIELNKVFKNMNSYEDLVAAFHAKKPLSRMNKEGIIKDVYPTFKLLKMDSVWK